MGFNLDLFSVKDGPKDISIKFDKKTLLSIDKENFIKFLNSLGNMEKTSKAISDTKSKEKILLSEMMRQFEILRGSYVPSAKKRVNATTYTTSDISKFKKAVKICLNYDITPKQLIEFNVERLAFLGDKIRFPSVSHITSPASENYISEKLAQMNLGEFFSPRLTAQDKELDLKDNKKFLLIIDKLKAHTASLEEATYLRNMFLFKKNKLHPKVEDYIESFTKKAPEVLDDDIMMENMGENFKKVINSVAETFNDL